jgi:hypothetical protein
MTSRRKRAAAAQLERMAERGGAPEIEIEIVDEGGAVIAEAEHGEIVVEHAEEPLYERREGEGSADAEPDALSKLKAQYAERETEVQRLKRENAEAERRASQNADLALQGERNYREATLAAVDNAIALARANVAQATAAMSSAAQRGDWDTHAKALAVLTDNNAQINNLESAKRQVESAPEPNPAQYNRPAPQNDNFEQQVANFPPRTQEWLRRHKDDIYLKPDRAGLAEAAANTARLKGIPVESDEYFAFIDEQMGYTTVSKQNGSAPAPAAQRQAQTPAAPPARSTFGSPAGKTRRVQLTKDQRAAAVQLYSDLPEAEALAKYAMGVSEIDSGKSNLLWSRDKYKGGSGV